MSMFVASSSGAAPKAHAVTHEPVSWFKTQLAADYQLVDGWPATNDCPGTQKGREGMGHFVRSSEFRLRTATANAVTAGKASDGR